MELVDKKLIVQRASMGQARMMGSDGQPVGLQIPLIMPTKVLMLLNMVQRDDLLDEEEYNGKYIYQYRSGFRLMHLIQISKKTYKRNAQDSAWWYDW